MFEQRSLKIDFAAILLAAVSAFVALSVLTFDPADPPSRLVYPANEAVGNVCGRVGAIAAVGMFHALGLGAYYLVASLVALSSCLLLRHSVTQPALRGIGWVISLGGIVTLLALAAPDWTIGTVIGSGGYLGAALRGFIEQHCARAGAYILAASFVAGGLLLSTDYLLLRAAALACGHSLRAVRTSAGQVSKLVPSKPAPRGVTTDIDNVEIAAAADADEEDEFHVPIKRSSAEASRDAAGEVSKEEAVESGAEETAEAEAAPAEAESDVRVRPPRKNERQLVLAELDAASRVEPALDYELPPLDLLLDGEPFSFEEQEKDVRRKAKILEKTFANFGFRVKVVEVETGPVIAQFEVELEAGLRLSKITSLSEDLAIALRVPSVRIVAPIPGKNTVGIEVPNAERQLVRLREVIEEANGKAAKMRIPIYLGKDVSGKPIVVDLSTLPHLLIAGRTGTGKSVCLNTIIMSMLMTRRPDDVRMLLIDPKMVELSSYMKLPHLMHPVVTDMRKAEAILGWAVEKMEERYALLARAGVRHISVYNQLGDEELFDRLQPESDEERSLIPTHLPYIVIVADEMADLMMTAAKEVEAHIIRLAQKSRAVGIHLVLATQKPTVDVITGLIKSNLPARISFQVASRTDSRVVLDEMGADKLLGNGDMLFLWPGTSMLLRGQGAYVSDDEITRVVDFAGQHEPQFVNELMHLKVATGDQTAGRKGHDDDLFDAAVDIVIREGRGSVSLLQRALGIGYGRAARLIDYMAEDGIVGQYNGSQAREVLVSLEQWRQMTGGEEEAESPPPRSGRLLTLDREEDPSPAGRRAKSKAKTSAQAQREGSRSGRSSVAAYDSDDDEAQDRGVMDSEIDEANQHGDEDEVVSPRLVRRDWADEEESDTDEAEDEEESDELDESSEDSDEGESEEDADEELDDDQGSADDSMDDEGQGEDDPDIAPWEPKRIRLKPSGRRPA